uniref:UPAR/Ly6 domain-containing protein n=1 Tax=Parastrongyloides trichosuri TaxID=131310 RepID=A0A0N4ZYT1_PARTI
MHYKIHLLFISILLLLPFEENITSAIQCYSGSQLQMIECPSMSCIKQTLGLDTVRYCDGTGVSSICQTYQIFDSCSNIPNLGYICCCSSGLCNSTSINKGNVWFTIIPVIVGFLFFARN